jgi:hypothetical protein
MRPLSSISLTDLPVLPGWNRGPFATGRSKYADRPKESRATFSRIFLEVWPGHFPLPVMAIVDTAAPWCIFKPGIGEYLSKRFDLVSDEISLSTRLGTFKGNLYRGSLLFPILEGEPLDVEATVFVSSDWPGENFLGYEGLLQRIRFAVDPETNLFYFGQI